MTNAPAGNRSSQAQWLRLGIVQNGRLLEERLLPARREVTIGTSHRSTVLVPAEGLPQRWRLFEARRGQRVLRLSPAMSARLAVGGRVTRTEATDDTPEPRLLPLLPGTRGKVSAGEVTVLFQLLPPPPARPRPRLPASVRGGPWTGLDRLFAGVALASLLVHLAFVLYLRGVDWPRNVDPETLLDEFPRYRLPPPRPPRPAPPAPLAEAPARAPARPASPAHAPVRPAPTREQLAERVRHMGINQLLTAKGGSSALPDLLRSGAVDRDLEQAMRGVSAMTTARAEGPLALAPVTGPSGRVVDVGGLRDAGEIATAVELGPRHERSAPKVEPEKPLVENGTADAAGLARVIRQGLAAVRGCYERALKRSPRLAGKLVLRFAVTAAGTVNHVDIDEDSLGDEEVDRCLRALFLRWRFPPPVGGPAEISFPFVFQPGA